MRDIVIINGERKNGKTYKMISYGVIDVMSKFGVPITITGV